MKKFIVYSNTFIALCAFSQVLLTTVLFDLPFNSNNISYLFFVLLSTYVQYNMQREYMVQQTNQFSERAQWLQKNRKYILYTSFISLFILLFLCNNLSWTSIGIMVGAEVISTLYYMPPFNLRKHGYIKPFLVSAIWTISCCVVPLLENKLLNTTSLFYCISQFFFISHLCVVFDIKDMEDDYLKGVNTYANKLGITITKVIAIALIILTSLFLYLHTSDFYYVLAGVLISVVSGVSVFLTNENKHSFYYYLWIDGLLILQAIIYITLSLCK